MFPRDSRDLNDLTNINIAVASNPTVHPDPHNRTDPAPEQEPDEPRMIGDFDGSANEFWKLFRDEAKSHDDVQVATLKDDMQNSLVFVRSYPICTYSDSVVLMRCFTGWFIFCYSHSIRSR